MGSRQEDACNDQRRAGRGGFCYGHYCPRCEAREIQQTRALPALSQTRPAPAATPSASLMDISRVARSSAARPGPYDSDISRRAFRTSVSQDREAHFLPQPNHSMDP